MRPIVFYDVGVGLGVLLVAAGAWLCFGVGTALIVAGAHVWATTLVSARIAFAIGRRG